MTGAGAALVSAYTAERDGKFAPEKIQTAMKAADAAPPLKIVATHDRLQDAGGPNKGKTGSP